MVSANFSYPAMTNLLPQHNAVLQYHIDFVSHYNLSSYIRLNHDVMNADWVGNGAEGYWNLTIDVNSASGGSVTKEYKIFDHIILALGTEHYPNTPTWPGLDAWLSADKSRKVTHSIYYDGPEEYANQTILVVGDGGSGVDIMKHTTAVSRKVCILFTF